MKRIAAVLLILCIALSLVACGEAQGKTKTIYVQTKTVRTVYDQEVLSEYTYSNKGDLLTSTMYFNGNLYQKITRRQSAGITYITVTDAQGNSSVQTNKPTYDDNGNVTKIETGYSGNTVSTTTYTYDDRGNMLTATTKAATSTTATVYTYDDRDNVLTMEVTVTGDNESYTKTTYTYNEKNYVLREEEYDAEGVRKSYLEYDYEDDDSGRTVTHYNGDGTATGEVDVCSYDENGNLIQQVTTLAGEVAQTIVYTYEALEVPVEE